MSWDLAHTALSSHGLVVSRMFAACTRVALGDFVRRIYPEFPITLNYGIYLKMSY